MTVQSLIKASSQLDEITAVIGREAVVRLCEALGGTRIYVPRVIGDNHPIAAAIGARPAAQLADLYHGTVIDLPKAHLRRQQAIELAKSGELTAAQVALQTDFSERHVRRLMAAEDDGQLDLPF